ncbi:MAG: sensor histidine kinase [Defluviitaleaceae bacterium]|nr:sensor histidine kinase [Defluviitaleaceae bacterium]MCL2836568.1 sensor histidine kinase [Defluviitaleaceae bacterium]
MRLLNNLKFRTQLNAGFTMIILFIIATVMIMLHLILRESYRNQENQVLEAYGRQIAINIDNRIEYFMSYLRLLATNKELLQPMENGNHHQVGVILNDITSEFTDLHTARIRDIRLHRRNAFGEIDDLYNAISNIGDVFNEFIPGNTAYRDNFLITGTYLNNRNEKVFSIFKKVYQTNPEWDYYLEMCVYETELIGFFSSDKSGNLICVTNGRNLMSMSDRTLFGPLLHTSRQSGELFILSGGLDISYDAIAITAGNSGFDVVIEVIPDNLNRGYRLMMIRLVPVIIGVLASSFVFVALMSMRFGSRLKTLQEKIAAISSWELSTDLRVDGSDEFGMLAGELDETRKRILDLIAQNNDINELKRVAEMSALRAQINSHFLFNSLSSIKWLSHQGNPDVLADAVESLAIFLRYSLVLDENQVPLHRELNHLEAYIYLQKLRYGKEINVHIDIDTELMGRKTVKLILQPLIENSVYHGRGASGNHLNITIYSYADAEFYYLVVEDDGIGIPKEVIDKINEGDKTVSKSGYGLRNVIERVKLCSEGLGDVIIDSKEGVCTKITIYQPH